MKSFLRFVSVAVLVAAAQVLCAATFQYDFSYAREDVQMHVSPDGEVAVRLEGCKLAPTDPGSPWLPVKEFSFRVPEGETIMDWSVEAGESVLLAEDVLPVFAPRPHKTGGVDEDRYVPATRNEALYGSADPYPATRAELVHSGNMRGVTIASFRVSPIWFVGAERKLYFTPSITVKIVTGVPPKATVAAADAAFAPPSSRLFEDAIDAMVINPKNDGLTPRPPAAVPKSGSGCEYLVITKEAFLAPARKLSEFRKVFDGVTSEVVTMETINANYSGTDSAAKLRACIKWYVQNKGTEYVVLAGDDRVVPIREVYVYEDAYTYYNDAPSDLYYSDLDGTWDADGDGVYGERSADGLDLLPDVIVGRLPMRTPAQLATYVDKVIRYEETTTDESDIVRKTLWFGYTLWDTLVHFDKVTVNETTVNDAWCSVNMDYQSDGNGGYVKGTTNLTIVANRLNYQRPTERHCDGLMEFLDRPFGTDANDAEVWCRRLHEMFFRTNSNWRTSFAFGSATSWDRNTLGDYQMNGDTDWGRTNTVQEILNQGYHFAGLDTHGNYAYVSFEGYETWSSPKGILGSDGYYRGSSSYYSKDAITLTNRVDIFCTEACITGGFDLDGNASCPAKRNADNAESPNFAEGFLRAPNGGSVAFVGCAREGFSYPMQETSAMASGWQDPNHFSAYYNWTEYGPEYSKDYVRGFWREVVRNRAEKLGGAFAASKSEWVPKSNNTYYHWLQLLTNLLGDPLLTVHTPPPRSQENRAISEHSMVTLLRDHSLELTSSSAKIHVAADGIILGETAEVKLEYSTSSSFSGAQSVTVASGVKNLGEFSKTLTGLNAGTKYYVRGKMTVTDPSGSTTCTSPFTTSFTTLPANSVGGRIAQNGAGLAGITVTALNADGTSAGTATTDANGQYSIALSAGWTGSVEPTMPTGKGAFPGSRTVTIPAGGSATADFEVKSVVYVNCRATGTNDGSSWTDAFTSLADAFTASSEGTVLWVAEGVYTPANLHGRDSHFAPPANMQAYGGFAGGETSLAQRDWIAHPTVLSGDLGATGKCYHVIRWAQGTLLDGFGITGGRMDTQFSSSTYEYGVAVGSPQSNPVGSMSTYNLSLAVTNGCYMVLDHCSVTNNYAKDPRASSDSYRYGTLFKTYYVWARNTLVANNELDGSDGAIQGTILDNCTVTGNKNYCAIVSDCIVRNSIVYGNTKTLTHANEPKTDYSGSWQSYWKNWMVYLGSAQNCTGSTRFLTESLICYSYNQNPPTFYPGASNWFRGTAGQNTPGWVASGSFPYALAAGSFAAEKGIALDWMDETTLDYLGNPRVNGAAPDLGCCEVPSGDNPPPPTPVAPTGTVASGDVSFTTAKVTATILDIGSESSASAVTTTLVVSKNADYSSPVFNNTVTAGSATSLSGLTANTTYYVKATFTGATAGSSTATATFKTSAYTAPSGTVSKSDVSYTSAKVTATISSKGTESANSDVTVTLVVSKNSNYASPVFSGTVTSGTAKPLTGLDPDTTYYVKATFTGRVSTLGTDATTTFKTSAYTAPSITSVSSASVTRSGATVTVAIGGWGNGSGGGEVKVELLTGGSTVSATKTGSAAGSFTFTGLSAKTTYTIRVTLTGDNGLTATDSSQSFTTLDVVPPTGSVAASAVSYTSATVTASIGALGDEAQASDVTVSLVVSKNSNYASPVFSGNLPTKALTNLEPDTTYYVKATFTGATSGSSDATATFKTLAYTAPTISSVSVGSLTRSSATVSVAVGGWGDGSDGGTVKVEVLSGSTVVGTKTGSATGSFAFTGLTAKTAYSVRVTLTGSNGLTASDDTKSFTTLENVPPTGTVSASAVSYTTATVTATLSSRGDEAKDSDVSISLVVSKKSDFSTTVFSGTVATKALTGLDPNTTYYVKATFTGATAGSSDATTSFRTLAYTAPTISSVSVGSVTTSGATVSVAVGGWGDGSTGGSVKVDVLSGGTVVDTKTGSATGDFAFTGLTPSTEYAVLVTLTGSNGLTATDSSKSFTTLAMPFVTLSAATATVSEDGASAVLSVTVEDTNISGGELALTLNGTPVKTWTLAKGTFSETVSVVAGSTNAFSFAATGSGVTETANGSFVSVLYVGWFDVRFGDAGFVEGADWIAQSTDASGGSFTAADETETTLVKGPDSFVTIGGEVIYTPSHASETDADVKINGRVQVSFRDTAPEIPSETKAAFCFVGESVLVLSTQGWTNLAGDVAAGEWVDYRFEFDYSSGSAPRVRYTVGAATSDWLPIAVTTRNVEGIRLRTGSFGDFKAVYASIGGDEPIELVRPEFATDGTGAVLSGTTYSLTISNPVKGAYYTVFTATKLTDTFTAEAASVLFDSSATTYTLTVDADTPTKFAKIVISSTPFKEGDPFPAE